MSIELKVGARRQLHAAAGASPVSGDSGETGNGAHRHAATSVALQSVVHTDERRSRPAITFCELGDFRRWNARNACDAFRRVLTYTITQRFFTQRETGEKVAVLEPALEDDMHHAKCEGRVSAWPNRNPLVALRCGSRSQRIDRDDRSTALPSLEHERPEMRVRGERVRSPEQHEIALGYSLGVGADVGADRHAHTDGTGHRADRAVEHRRADRVKESPVHR